MSAPGQDRDTGPGDVDPSGPVGVPIPGTFPLIEDADGFRRAAVHIFGAHGWLRQTSKCLGVNESTIWRWVSESGEVKPYALAAMSAWLRVFMTTGERPPRVDG